MISHQIFWHPIFILIVDFTRESGDSSINFLAIYVWGYNIPTVFTGIIDSIYYIILY